jgi:urease subunit gamma
VSELAELRSRGGLVDARSADAFEAITVDGASAPIRRGCPYHQEKAMHLTPREFDKLLIYMLADVAQKRKDKGIKLNHPEAVALVAATAMDGARAGMTIEDVTREASKVLSKDDVMDGVADLIPSVQVEAVFTDGSRLVTVHSPIQ